MKIYRSHIVDIPRIKFSLATPRLDEKKIFWVTLSVYYQCYGLTATKTE